MTAAWERMDVAWWPLIAAALAKPWPLEAMLFDLRWWEDQEGVGREKRPGRCALASRWGVGEKAVRLTIERREAWSSLGPDEGQSGASEGPAKGQREKGATSATGEKGPAKGQPRASLGPDEGQSGASVENQEPLTMSGDPLLSETGTLRDRTQSQITEHRTQSEHHAARETGADHSESDPMPTDHPGSRPTMDADPIDNDGATTPSPFRATPSPTEVSDGQAAPHHAQPVDLHRLPDAAGPVLPDAAPEAAAAAASTLSPAPATSETSATPDPGKVWSLHPQADVAPPPAKPKRKAKTATTLDLDAWGRCCQAWDTIRGKPGAWKPEAGMGRQIAEGIGRVGAARMEARLASVAAGTSPAGRKIRAFFDAEGADIGMLCWERGAKLLTALDGEIEQAMLDAEGRSGEPQAVGGVVGRSESQNAPERQPAPKQNGSAAWDDMLSVIRSTGGLRLSVGLRGSTLSHDAGEHKRRCQAVADIGGWAKLCELNDFNRMAIRAQWVSAYERAAVSA